MPQIIPAVVAAISYVGASATAVVAGTATLAQIATVAAVGIGAGVGSMALSKALTPEIGSQGAAVRWEANPDAPLRFAFGRVGVKGNIFDAAIYGPDRMYVSFACTVSAAGPIKRFVTFRAGDYVMSFDGAGAATNEPYRGEMWLSTRLGAQPDTALSLPSGLKNGAAFPGWNSGRKVSGSACYMVTLGENSKRSAYEGKIPAFISVIEGLYCYDPRLDSTYPGGSGSCRLNDPATWVWTENPILFGLKWALGLWEGPTGKGAPQVDYQVGGIGAKVEGIHLASFVEAANISDANGWKGAAWPSTDDDKAQVLDGFLKAGGSSYAEIGGKIACIHRAAPRAPVFTVTARDTAGPIEIDTASSKLNRINTIRPRYWSEAHEWEMTALPEVTSSVWQEEDGQGVAVKRTRGADWTFVPLPKQARELSSLQISNSREGIRGRVPLRPYMDPEPGNTFIFDEPDFALSELKCIVLDVEDNTDNDTVIVTFETETDGKYPFAYGQTASPPPAQELDPYDPTYVSPPLPGDWTITPRPPGSGGQLPGFDLGGIVSNDTATSIIVEHGPTDEGPWTQAYEGPPTVTNIPIDGLQPGATYYIAIQYRRDNNYSARHVYGPYEAPALIGDVDPNAPGLSDIKADIAAAFGDISDVSDELADARSDLDAQGVEIAAARGSQPTLGARVAELAQATYDGDTANATAIAGVEARTDLTEADIIDLDIALANETTARAEAISQVSARQAAPVNEFDGSDTSQGLKAVQRRWNGPDNVPLGLGVNDNGSFAIYKTGVGQAYGSDTVLGSVSLSGGPFNLISGAPGAWRVFSGERIGVALEITSASGTPASILCEARYYNNAGSLISTLASFRHPFGTGAFTRVGWVGNAPGDGYIQIEAYLIRQGYSAGATVFADAAIRRMTFARLNSNWPSNVLPAYAAPSNGIVSASVTEHSLAIIDLENQQALASYEVLANASGGLPAFLRLISSTAGGYAALAAPVVALMNTIVGGDPLVAMEARAGEVFFSRPIYITVPGTSYHLIVGGGGASGQQWLLWFGPNSTSAALATRTNGAMALGSDGEVYLGDAALGGSPKSATMSFSGNAGYSSGVVPQNIAGTTSPLTVPQSGKFVVDVSNVFVLSEGNGSSKMAIGSLALQIGKNGVYTTIASGISASTSNDIDPGAPVNASAMNLTVVHNFAGPVTFRVLAAGGGSSTQSSSVISGSLKATWYPT